MKNKSRKKANSFKWLALLLGATASQAFGQSTDTASTQTTDSSQPQPSTPTQAIKVSGDYFYFKSSWNDVNGSFGGFTSQTKGSLYGGTISIGTINTLDMSYRYGKITGTSAIPNSTPPPNQVNDNIGDTWNDVALKLKWYYKSTGYNLYDYIGLRYVRQDEVDTLPPGFQWVFTGSPKKELITQSLLIPIGLGYGYPFFLVGSRSTPDVGSLVLAPRVEGHIDPGLGWYSGSGNIYGSTSTFSYDAGAVGTVNLSWNIVTPGSGVQKWTVFAEGGYQYDYWGEENSAFGIQRNQSYYGPYVRAGLTFWF